MHDHRRYKVRVQLVIFEQRISNIPMAVVFRRYVAMKIEAQSPAIEPFVFSTFFLRNYNFPTVFFIATTATIFCHYQQCTAQWCTSSIALCLPKRLKTEMLFQLQLEWTATVACLVLPRHRYTVLLKSIS